MTNGGSRHSVIGERYNLFPNILRLFLRWRGAKSTPKHDEGAMAGFFSPSGSATALATRSKGQTSIDDAVLM